MDKTAIRLIDNLMLELICLIGESKEIEKRIVIPVPSTPERVICISDSRRNFDHRCGEEAPYSDMKDGLKYIGKHFTFRDHFVIYDVRINNIGKFNCQMSLIQSSNLIKGVEL